MLPEMRSPMRRSAAADSSEPSPSVGSAPDRRGDVGSGVPCVGVGCGKAAGLAASAATSSSFLKRVNEVKCNYLSGLELLKDPLHNSLRSVISRTRAVCCVVFLANSPAIGCKKTPCSPSRSDCHSLARVMQRVLHGLI